MLNDERGPVTANAAPTPATYGDALAPAAMASDACRWVYAALVSEKSRSADSSSQSLIDRSEPTSDVHHHGRACGWTAALRCAYGKNRQPLAITAVTAISTESRVSRPTAPPPRRTPAVRPQKAFMSA